MEIFQTSFQAAKTPPKKPAKKAAKKPVKKVVEKVVVSGREIRDNIVHYKVKAKFVPIYEFEDFQPIFDFELSQTQKDACKYRGALYGENCLFSRTSTEESN